MRQALRTHARAPWRGDGDGAAQRRRRWRKKCCTNNRDKVFLHKQTDRGERERERGSRLDRPAVTTLPHNLAPWPGSSISPPHTRGMMPWREGNVNIGQAPGYRFHSKLKWKKGHRPRRCPFLCFKAVVFLGFSFSALFSFFAAHFPNLNS